MADCSATGTALDRVIHSALSQQGNNGLASSHHAAKALGSFVGITAATADAAVGGQIMPSAPMESLPGRFLPDTMEGPVSSPMHHHSIHRMMHAPPQQMHIHQHMHPQQQRMMMQYQMMQMQMQQMHLAAMVEHQKAHQAAVSKQAESKQSAMQQTHSEVSVESDDVVTVNEEDEIYNEGIADHASIERLAQAWREAEAEYAAEFDDDEYNANLGSLYNEVHHVHQSEPCQGFGSQSTTPQYEFSPQSQTYGCISTPTTDLVPSLTYPDNLYERGIQHFDSGEISQAILCFESTLRNIDPEHADAWRYLAKCHTENDADSKAIACWLKSLESDPYSSETLLGLVVAYVNELDWEKAVGSLKMWVEHHPLYAGMESDKEEDLYGSSVEVEEVEGGVRRMNHSTMVEMRDVERLLLRALEYNHNDDAAADVYEALGVVYNVSRDYDAAVDSFERAILVRPHDYQLHNKLGATLANSNRSSEALPHYREALKLKPKYTRGWLNMAISHSNLRDYAQAARCYLQTLSLCPEARHVWGYLRIALTCDERWDLLPMAASMNLSGFREHFDFVEY